jgi:hypothetical protein
MHLCEYPIITALQGDMEVGQQIFLGGHQGQKFIGNLAGIEGTDPIA